jgi:hypothetical protein
MNKHFSSFLLPYKYISFIGNQSRSYRKSHHRSAGHHLRRAVAEWCGTWLNELNWQRVWLCPLKLIMMQSHPYSALKLDLMMNTSLAESGKIMKCKHPINQIVGRKA